MVFVPRSDTSYEAIVAILDASRNIEKTDPVLSVPNEKTGVQEQLKILFNDIVFGNLLGGTD
jgi:hypothetical protein